MTWIAAQPVERTLFFLLFSSRLVRDLSVTCPCGAPGMKWHESAGPSGTRIATELAENALGFVDIPWLLLDIDK